MIGYSLALLIGLSLGLLGGGGSILTVPVLVYVMKMDPKQSIALSLAIVGFTSLLGVWGHFKKDNVNLKIAAIFGPFAMLGAFAGAKISTFMSGQTQLLLFSIIMLLASGFMLKGRKESDEPQDDFNLTKKSAILLSLQGILVGVTSGVVGVGGGFLIVPALVLITKVNMKKAVGTSLLIIALNSFSGFVGYIGIVEIPWEFLLKFTLFSGAGIFIGSAMVQYVSQGTLKKIFAVFLIFMGGFILYKNRATLNLAKAEVHHEKNIDHFINS